MQSRSKEIERLVTEGANRLLSRAEDSRLLKPDVLLSRITAAVHKYLLRDDPQISAQNISSFIDGMQADDLCLIVACENNDESAWSDLVERFTTTVRSAARSASSNEDAAEDLVQSIWAELYGLRIGKDGKPSSKLAYYSGRGSLAGWLRQLFRNWPSTSFVSNPVLFRQKKMPISIAWLASCQCPKGRVQLLQVCRILNS